MTQFRTPVKIPESPIKITYREHPFLLGSCFTLNIGEKLQYFKFPSSVNPLGVLYNPVSVANGLKLLIRNPKVTKEDLWFEDPLWLSFFHDTSFSGMDPQLVLSKINTSLEEHSKWLQNTKFLFISLGTAWVYRHKKTGLIVSNNHKIPAREFERFRLSVDEIVKDFSEIIRKIQQINPAVHIIFTVSPVRHLKDGASENQVSKSTLLLSIDELKKLQKVDYFPSYEIMMDELRDYRFYAPDMIHPGTTGIDYIWQRFEETYITDEARRIMKQVEKVNKAFRHRPLNANSEEYKTFAEKQIHLINSLHQSHPFLDFTEELSFFKKNLSRK